MGQHERCVNMFTRLLHPGHKQHSASRLSEQYQVLTLLHEHDQ